MTKKEGYQKIALISALITFVGIALFILSILDSWNLGFLIPGAILFFIGIKFGIIYSHKARTGRAFIESKFFIKIFKILKLKKLMELKLKLLEKYYTRKKKRLKNIIRKL